MLRFFLALLLLSGSVAAQNVLPSFPPGAMLRSPSTDCAPIVYAASPVYQSLTLSGWIASNTTNNSNALFSPACVVTGANVVENSATAVHEVLVNTNVVTAVQTYTLTAYSKRNSGTRNVRMTAFNSTFASQIFAGYDLSNCTINIALTVLGGGFVAGTATSSSYGNGWCKIAFTYTGLVDTNTIIDLLLLSGTTTSYAGDGASSIGLWGVDLR